MSLFTCFSNHSLISVGINLTQSCFCRLIDLSSTLNAGDEETTIDVAKLLRSSYPKTQLHPTYMLIPEGVTTLTFCVLNWWCRPFDTFLLNRQPPLLLLCLHTRTLRIICLTFHIYMHKCCITKCLLIMDLKDCMIAFNLIWKEDPTNIHLHIKCIIAIKASAWLYDLYMKIFACYK